MDERLGLHLDTHEVAAVAVAPDGTVRDHACWPPPAGQDRWQYSESDARALCTELSERFDRGRCTLAVSVPIEAIYFRRVAVPEADEAGSEAVRYAAEPLLPLPLDELHLAIRRRGEHAEVLALPLEPWARVLRALDEAHWLCPKAVCDADACVQAIEDQTQAEGGAELLALLDSQRGIVGVRCGGAIQTLRPLTVPRDAEHLGRELERSGHAACGEMPWTSHLWASEAVLASVGAPVAPLRDRMPAGLPDSLAMFSAWQAARALKAPSVVNLRTGPLGSSPIRRRTRRWKLAHSTAATLMLLVLAGALIARGGQLRAQAAAYEADSQRIWSTLFPDRPPPQDIVSLLVSEQARERGLREATASGGAVPNYEPALDTLGRVIAGLPEDVRLRVQQIEMTDGVSVITGQARGHGKVEQIAAGIQTATGLAVEPPRTRRTNAGPVRFTLRLNQEQDDE